MNKCKVASFPNKGKSCSPLAGCRCPKKLRRFDFYHVSSGARSEGKFG